LYSVYYWHPNKYFFTILKQEKLSQNTKTHQTIQQLNEQLKAADMALERLYESVEQDAIFIRLQLQVQHLVINQCLFRVGLVRPEGFEPPTTWFEARYSIQLSYERKFKIGAQDYTVNP
jgi:hypothetical protein